jgi:glycosyltransferase involved in cell wall biosynthesis
MTQDTTDPFISVVVCTRNRGRPLADMLQSLADMDQPGDAQWELVVVDNGSTDETPAVIQGFADRLPLRTVREEQAGLSYARNCGVREARGHYIVWTDDDVRVDRGWLAAYSKAFRAHPEAAYFGGRINPVFEGRTPAWLEQNLDKLGNAFARRELGDRTRRFTSEPDDVPFGANFAVRAKEQRAIEYPVYLGVSPNFRRVGEETAVLNAVRAAGEHGYWVPGASVDHIIPESRQSLDYIMSYHRATGETWAVLSRRPENEIPVGNPLHHQSLRFAGVPLRIWGGTLLGWVRYRLARLFGRPSSRWVPRLMEYSYCRGALEYLRQPPA